MAVEFSRRPLLSLQLSLWLSIFNLNSSCNWLEGREGGTLLVGCAVPHGSQCAGSPLPLKTHFAAMQRFASALDALYSFTFVAPARIERRTPGRIFSKAFLGDYACGHDVQLNSFTMKLLSFRRRCCWNEAKSHCVKSTTLCIAGISLPRPVCWGDREK